LFAGDAGGPGALDAHIEHDHLAVAFITLSCSGSCADVEAVATGGVPPYHFAWNDGATTAARRVCPDSNTSYSVTVTDTGSTGELAHAPETATAAITADVTACPDGGVSDAGADVGPPLPGDGGSCDRLAASASSTGANPSGTWSYGWTPSLGGTFGLFSSFSPLTIGMGVESWGQGFVSQTIADFNTTSMPVTVRGQPGTAGTFTIPALEFALGPNASGEYSVVRWTAPASGTYTAFATFTALGAQPAGNDVNILQNGTVLGSSGVHLNGGPDSVSLSLAVHVSAGDTVDFATGPAGVTSQTLPEGDYFVGVNASLCPAGP
jgi:hypothetical protein